MTFAKKIINIFPFFLKTKDIYHLIHLVLAMGYGAGKGRRVNYGGLAARGSRHTLREIWHSSNTTLDFPEWVLSLEDQVDLNNSIAGSHYTTDHGQYFDSATHQWHPYDYGPAFQATTAPITTAPYVLTPHAIPTSATAPPTAPPHVITPATLTPTAPAPAPPTAHAPAPPSASVMNSPPAAAKAKPALPDPSQTTPTATAPTTTAATTTLAPSTTPLTPAPPSYPPPNHDPAQAPWRATGTAQLAATRKELNDALLEFSQLKTEYTEQEAQLATEQHSYNQESAAFMQEMEMRHSEQGQCHEAKSELRNFQRLFRIDAVTDKTWPMVKNWQAWMGHLSSEFSHKLKKEQGMVPGQLPRINFSIAGTAASSVTSACHA